MAKIIRDLSNPYGMPDNDGGGLTPIAMGLLVTLVFCVVVGGIIWLIEPTPMCECICQPKEKANG